MCVCVSVCERDRQTERQTHNNSKSESICDFAPWIVSLEQTPVLQQQHPLLEATLTHTHTHTHTHTRWHYILSNPNPLDQTSDLHSKPSGPEVCPSPH